MTQCSRPLISVAPVNATSATGTATFFSKLRAALNAALARGDAATNLRLRQQAVKDFDRLRLGVVGAAVRGPLLLMSPKVASDRTIEEQSASLSVLNRQVKWQHPGP